jgi:beta-lactamase class A
VILVIAKIANVQIVNVLQKKRDALVVLNDVLVEIAILVNKLYSKGDNNNY